MEDSIPTTSVIAKPLTAPVPIVNNAIAAIKVVILASDIVEKAFYYTYQNPNIDTILLGITSVNQLDQYIDWVNRLYCNNKIYINTLVEMSKLIHNKLWN